MDGKVTIIGRAEKVSFPELKLANIPARIDTGAKTSSIWATQIEEKDGQLQFVLFDTASEHYSGKVYTVNEFELRNIASSTGQVQERYVVKLLVELHGKKIRTSFSLANRSQQVYPVLVGRNTLRGKFIVDVKLGNPHSAKEVQRSRKLQQPIKEKKS